MVTRADIAVATHLGQSIEPLSLGSNLYHGPARDQEGTVVYCAQDGGFDPIALLGDSTGVYTSTVNVIVRGGRGRYSEGLDLARSVQASLQFAALGTDFISSRVENSSPIYMGEDRNGGPEWLINLSVTYKE